jgi:hypothetical protein
MAYVAYHSCRSERHRLRSRCVAEEPDQGGLDAGEVRLRGGGASGLTQSQVIDSDRRLRNVKFC